MSPRGPAQGLAVPRVLPAPLHATSRAKPLPWVVHRDAGSGFFGLMPYFFFPGHFYSGQSSSGSGLRTAASRVGSFLWQVFTSPGEWGAWWVGGFLAAPFFLTSIFPPHALCVLVPDWAEGWEQTQGQRGHLWRDPA